MNAANPLYSVQGMDTLDGELDIPLTEQTIALEEIPVAVCINGISQAVMMASPDQLEAFGLGFALSEGWVEAAHHVLDIEVDFVTEGASINLTVLAADERRLKVRRRSMAGPTGCGLCGVESLRSAMRLSAEPLTAHAWVLPNQRAIVIAQRRLSDARHHTADFGRHAAALFTQQGDLLIRQTDVGRHCALDKLIGTVHQEKRNISDAFVMLTSRCSHDLVAKLAQALPCPLVTLSQPTSLAVASAKAVGLPLFCYQQRTLRRFA